MDMRLKSDWQPGHSLIFAHMCCFCLGTAMLAWGIAPAVVERIISGEPPPFMVFAWGSITLLVGITFVGLHLLVRQGIRWALWTAYLFALALVTITFTAVVLSHRRMGVSFLLVLSVLTAFSAWLALEAGARKNKIPEPQPANE